MDGRGRGVPEAGTVGQGVHVATMAWRQWDEPFLDEALDLGGRSTRDDIRRAVASSASAD
jgi:hypothetical protein